MGTGVVRKHGHGHNRPYCAGSGSLPVRISSHNPDPSLAYLDVTDDTLGVTVETGSGRTLDFNLSSPSRPTIRRIPRGSRSKAAQAFESRLRTLLSSPDDLGCWRNLLSFADCLSQPVRGGKRQTLTSQISS